MTIQILKEAKNLNQYKKLIRTLGDYYDAFPGISNKYLDQALEHGVKIMPKDKYALAVIDSIISSCDSVPAKVQSLLNVRFAELPKEIRPMYKDGRRTVVAFWSRGNKVYDRVLDLIGFADGKAEGFWSDMEGNRVKLVSEVESKKD